MPYYAFIVILLVAGCGTHQEPLFSTIRYANSSFAHRLTSLIDRIEGGDLAAWESFKSSGVGLDGEYSQTYSIACAELVTRDPTFFLRLYLRDDASVIPYAYEAYAWSGDAGRTVLDQIYDRRLRIEGSSDRRVRIEKFVNLTTGRTENQAEQDAPEQPLPAAQFR
jgi:hypothetical protein